MRVKFAVLALSLLLSRLAIGQVTPSAITNADVVGMVRAGIGDQTIIIAIQRGPVNFDTSPQALIALKSGGVSDQVLNAILASTNRGQAITEATTVDARAVFQKVIDALGAHEKVTAVQAVRWKGLVSGGAGSSEREVVRVYPDKVYMSSKIANGQSQTEVVTPDFSYKSAGKMTTSVTSAELDTVRDQLDFDPVQVAQHPMDYEVALAGEERIGNIAAAQLSITKLGKNIKWEVDTQTGRLLSTRLSTPTGELLTEFSDWRPVDGVLVAFKRRTTRSQGASELTITEYEVNPAVDESLFQRPAQAPAQGITLKVLQAESVPYIQQSGGGISTSCNIVGSANTSGYANSVGNSTFGSATTNSTQHMSCSSYDTTVRWPHVLNVMFAEASDGNSYMFACDRAWRWSKCVPLRVGQVFNASFTDKGLEVEAFNTKGKEENPTYHVLQSRSLR